jgi:hypothetical protein
MILYRRLARWTVAIEVWLHRWSMYFRLRTALQDVLAQQGIHCTTECAASQRMVEIASAALTHGGRDGSATSSPHSE